MEMVNTMSVLCVLSNKFPYGNIETYMESEVEYYTEFEEVHICSLIYEEQTDDVQRKVPDSIKVTPINVPGRFTRRAWGVSALFDANFYLEIKRLIKEHRFTLKRLYYTLNYLSRAHIDACKIKKKIGSELVGKSVVIYSYRFEYQPYVAILLKKKLHLDDCVIVSRAHRYDLYEDRNHVGYIPMRYAILRDINCVYPCSYHGEKYLKDLFPMFEDKIKASFLGTNDYGVEPENAVDDELNIVSCSNVVPVKRLDKIIETIKNMSGYKIRWTHYGDGELMEWLHSEVQTMLSNVTVTLKGSVPNHVILKDYKEHYYDFFINLSDSEGLPVSIMEAMSFGIPCVASDAGGTPEIVENNINGLLVSVDAKPDDIAMLISENINHIRQMRQNCRGTWERKFSAKTNYSQFINQLKQMQSDRS